MKKIKDLIPDYALGLLSPAEAQEVERFLEACESCQAELANYNGMFVNMVESLPLLEPETNFSSLKHKVVSARTIPEASVAQTEPKEDSTTTRSDVVPWWQRIAGQWRYQAAGFAMSLALCIVGFWGWTQYQNNQQMTQAQSLIKEWLAAEDTKSMPLKSEAGETIGNLLVQDKSRALVVLSHPPDDGRIYQAWGELDSVCTSLAMSDESVFEISWSEGKYNSIIVSSEPTGGSESSTNVLSQVFF